LVRHGRSLVLLRSTCCIDHGGCFAAKRYSGGYFAAGRLFLRMLMDALPSLPLCVGGLADALPLFSLGIWWMLYHRCHDDDVSSCRSSCLQGR